MFICQWSDLHVWFIGLDWFIILASHEHKMQHCQMPKHGKMRSRRNCKFPMWCHSTQFHEILNNLFRTTSDPVSSYLRQETTTGQSPLKLMTWYLSDARQILHDKQETVPQGVMQNCVPGIGFLFTLRSIIHSLLSTSHCASNSIWLKEVK